MITRDDIMSMADYGKVRAAKRREVIETKRRRRIHVGPLAVFHFESYETMWAQIHEMLWIERGGEAQVEDELAAYNPLIPQGQELVATMMFEIDDPVRRARLLAELTGVERTVSLRIGGETVAAAPIEEDGVERTKADGKTSAIHFLRFPMAPGQAAAFKAGAGDALLAIGHPKYGHMAVLPDEVRQALASDLA